MLPEVKEASDVPIAASGTGFSLHEALKEAKRRSVEELGAIDMRIEDESIPPGLVAQKFVDEFIGSEKGNEVFLIKYLPRVAVQAE